MPPTPGHLEFEVTHGSPQASRRIDPETPLRVLLIGDFGARWHRVLNAPFMDRAVYRLDLDNLDDVLASFGANLTIPLPGEEGGHARIMARSLDDFHPDTLLKKVPSLAELLTTRKALDSATPHAAAEKMQALLKIAPASPAPTTAAQSPPPSEASGESAQATLSRLLGQSPPPKSAPPAEATGELNVQNVIQRILSSPGQPTPPPPPGLPGLINAAELELSARLRSLLHDADLQAVEATWRGLDFLLRRCPDEERVHYHVLDASLEEIAADLTGLQRLLRDEPWNVIIGLFTFGETSADLETLGGLGGLAGSLGAALLAGAHPQLIACDSFDQHPDPDDWKFPMPYDVRETWQNLRTTEAAAHIGLALPRFLLRQPYGKAGDAIERFAFEEMTDASSHENFLWGNSALLAAKLLIEGHATGKRVAGGNLADLPAGRYFEHGGTALKPCAEAWLVDRAADVIARKGLIAVQSFKGRDAAQIAGLNAICHPDKPSRIIG